MRTRPDFILLSALRGDPQAATFLMTARTIVDELPTRIVRMLSEPVFWCTVDASFVRSGVPNEPRGPFAVLAGPETDPILTFDDDLVYSESEPHREALDAVRSLWASKRSAVVLEPGDTLIIDNSRVIHGRSEYYPKFDGGDRWLVRQQVLKSLASSRFARNGISPVIEMWGV
jgi:L-asparagine oxygenase